MHLNRISLLGICMAMFQSRWIHVASQEDSQPVTSGCVGTEWTAITFVNASNSYMLDNAVINCLSFSDATGAISFGVVSYEQQGGMQGRSTIQCVNSVLVVAVSLQPYSENFSSCFQCVDSEGFDSCPNNADCSDGCRFCYGGSDAECLVCQVGRYEGECVDSCPNGTNPNPNLGNECECRNYFSGVECTDCLITKYNCSSAYYFNKEDCNCETCTFNKFELKDPESTVPKSVIGEPLGEECTTSDKRRRATEDASDGFEEDLICVEECSGASFEANKNTDNICYACGINYCLECDTTQRICERCRDGTLLNEDDRECHPFYEEICQLRNHFEEEVEHEEELLKAYQLHLKIILPIVCAFVLFVFVGCAVFAHIRYPHVGHEKRHRRPNKATEKKTDFEKVLRPQSTVIFR